jgi:hypothetical protein
MRATSCRTRGTDSRVEPRAGSAESRLVTKAGVPNGPIRYEITPALDEEQQRFAAILSVLFPRRLRCQADRLCGAGGVAEKVVDAADEVAFETADRFALGPAVGALLGEVDVGAWVVGAADDGEHVEPAVVAASAPASSPGRA